MDSTINANILVGGTSQKAAVVLRKVAEGLRFACGQYGSFTVFAVSLRFTAFRRILVNFSASNVSVAIQKMFSLSI